MPRSKRKKKVPEGKDPRGWGVRKFKRGRPRSGVEYRVDGRVKGDPKVCGGQKTKLRFGNFWLTLEQKRFVDLVVKEDYITNLPGAYMEAWGLSDRTGATRRVSSMLKKNNDVMPAIKEGLLEEEYQDVIQRRLKEFLQHGTNSDFFKATEIWAKFTGTFAPEKQAILQVNKEDKDAKLQEIMGLLDIPTGESSDGEES